MANITKRLVEAIKPQENRLLLWDDSLPRFGLRVSLGGIKSFVYQYRDPECRTRRLATGKYGKISAEQARNKAAELAAKFLLQGDDPAEKRRAVSRIPPSKSLPSTTLRSTPRKRAPRAD